MTAQGPAQSAETSAVPPTPEAVAELLRLADFALDRSTVSMIAFTSKVHTVTRDCERNQEVRRQIKGMLEHLPPKPPLTPEQEAEAAKWVARALARIDGAKGGEDA